MHVPTSAVCHSGVRHAGVYWGCRYQHCCELVQWKMHMLVCDQIPYQDWTGATPSMHVFIAGANSAKWSALQSVPSKATAFAQGVSGLFPASENEVNQELQAEQLTIDALAQRTNQLTPVRDLVMCVRVLQG